MFYCYITCARYNERRAFTLLVDDGLMKTEEIEMKQRENIVTKISAIRDLYDSFVTIDTRARVTRR